MSDSNENTLDLGLLAQQSGRIAQRCHQGLGMFGVSTTGFGNWQVEGDLLPSEAPFDRLVSVASKSAQTLRRLSGKMNSTRTGLLSAARSKHEGARGPARPAKCFLQAQPKRARRNQSPDEVRGGCACRGVGRLFAFVLKHLGRSNHPMRTAIRYAFMFAAVLAVLVVCANAQPPDFSKVQIKTNKISENFYTIDGQGGTIGLLVGPDGIFMVDDQFAPLTDRIVAAIKQISNMPIKFVVNTHVHGDHTGGNENLGRMGVTIVARNELRNRLMHPSPAANGTPGVPTKREGLPSLTFEEPIQFRMNGETAVLIPILRAHTDGDTMVRFVSNDIIMTGDFYRSVQYPNIDRVNGGSLNGMINGLGQILARSGPNTKIIPGHGPTVDRSAVMMHRDMLIAVRDHVSKLLDQGKSQDEVLAAQPTADYDAKVPNSKETTQRFVTQVYAELKAAR